MNSTPDMCRSLSCCRFNSRI